MLNIDQEKYRYSISNIGMENIDIKYRYTKRKILIFSICRYRYWITTWSSSEICHLVCSQCSMLSVYLKCLAIFPVDKNIEERIYLKFCIANGISCAASLKMLQKAYGQSTLSKTCAYKWYSAFKRCGGRFALLWSAINAINWS